MGSQSSRLPSRLPVGTKFVIEGRLAREGQPQVVSRHLEFPDGTFFPLPARAPRPPIGKIRRARRVRSRMMEARK